MERVDAYPVSAAELIHLDDGQDEPEQAIDALSIVEEAAVGGELKGGVLTPLALRRPRGGDELLLGSGDGDEDFLEGGHSDRFEELLEGDDLDGDDELECGHLLQRRRASDPSAAALALFAAQLAVVKTVKNSDWTRLLRGWTDAPDPNQRSSLSLPPAGGRGMHLFGKVGSGCAGIAWDRRAIDISDALCWPSGYYAKTEHNMEVDERSGRVLLSNGRADALVTIDDLVAANLSHDASRLLGDDPPHLSYNEISIRLPGPAGIAAVFVRSARPSHVIFALGVRALLAHSFPELRSLPLLLLTPDDGARAIGPSEELAVIRDHLGAAAPSLFEDRNQRKAVHVVEPRLPLDLSRYPQLSPQEVLTFHAVHGVTRRTLTRLFPTLRAAGDLPGFVSLALAAAAAADNAPSAREVVRAAAPLMLLDAAEGRCPLRRRAARRPPPAATTATPAPAVERSSCVRRRRRWCCCCSSWAPGTPPRPSARSAPARPPPSPRSTPPRPPPSPLLSLGRRRRSPSAARRRRSSSSPSARASPSASSWRADERAAQHGVRRPRGVARPRGAAVVHVGALPAALMARDARARA